MIIYDLICFITVRCVLLFPLECIRPEESEVWWELTDPPGLHNRALKAAKGPCSNESALRLGENQDFRRRATCFLGKVPWKCALRGPSWDPGLQQSISRVRTLFEAQTCQVTTRWMVIFLSDPLFIHLFRGVTDRQIPASLRFTNRSAGGTSTAGSAPWRRRQHSVADASVGLME